MSDRHFSFSSSDGSSVPPSPHSEGPASSKISDKGIQQTIQNLQNEQERVQKKTFTNWMNTYLCQRNPPIKVENLFEEIKDGVVLLSLLEVLSGERLPMEKGTKLRRPHHLANISTALNFLEKKKIKLVNINATSVADGKPSIVLGLVWTIILYFQIEETFNAVPGSEGDSKRKAPLPKQNMLDWAESVLTKKYGLRIKDFGKSWTDGVAFNAMIHNIRPDLVDMDKIQKQESQINLEHAFSTAETELGIPRLLDPEDVNVEKPDEKSIMTYVAQFLKAYPGGGSGVPGTNIETVEKEMKAYNSLMNWLSNEARDVLATTQEPVTNRESEFMDYLGFKTELDRREPLFLKLGEKVLSGRALRITRPELEKLDLRWQEVDEQMRLWLQKLDAYLPGKLGKLGQWLYEAEKLLKKKEVTTDNAEDMVALYTELAQEHRKFFQDLKEWNQFFAQIKRAGRYEDMVLHGPQFDHLSKRLESVSLLSPVRQNRLDYVVLRYQLLAALLVAEDKVGQWTVKYGKQEFVEEILADYVDLVDRQKICEKLERIHAETKKAADKVEGADKTEVAHINKFLEEMSGRWKKVSTEIRSVRSLLEEVVAAWKRYHVCVDLLTVWLTEGEQVMGQSLESKEEFFKDLVQYEEKLQSLNEAGNFLIDVSKEPTATQIKQTLQLLNRRFTDLVESFHSYHQTEVIDKARLEYDKGVLSVENWLSNFIDIFDHVVKCIHADLKAYLLEMDQYSSQIQEVENNFKITTRTAQSLVKDSSQEDVNTMLETLNIQKEAIVKLRKEIPERMKYLKAILPNVESLETGILDLQNWLSEGERLLSTHKLEGTPEETFAQLEMHKAFFTETTYQKSILESKNKVYQKICDTKAKLQNVDFTPAEDLMSSTNERFQNVVTNAKEWNHKLETLARLWRSLQQKQLKLEEWLDTAQNIMDDSEDDLGSLIRKHKMFFDHFDRHLMSDYESNANEILQQLNLSEQKFLSQTMNHLKERWEHVLHQAPIRLLKLEFTVPEDKFEQFMEMADTALQQQQQLIRSNQNLKEALSKHRQMFQDGSFVTSCEQLLDQMKDLAQQLLKLSSSERSLDERYMNQLDRWRKLQMMIDNTHLQLKQLPEHWKEYNERLCEFDGWVLNIEKLLEGLNQEQLTSDEYKEKLLEFQKEVRNLNKYQDNSKWLEQHLEELIKDAPDDDSRRERERLQGSQNRFHKLKPDVDSVLEKSAILSKGYEYRDNVDKKMNWLDEAHRMATEHRPIDMLEDARAYMHENETLLNKLEIEKANIQAEIDAGRHLQRDRNAPPFIQQSVTELDKKWKDTHEVVKARHEKIKRQVEDWERYEGEKATLLTYMKKAEDELEHPLETLNQESAQKDLESKKELQNTLSNLKDSLVQMIKLNAVLTEEASQECQGQLKDEVVDFNKKLDAVRHRLDAKLADLETTVGKWNEYYKRLNSFSDWLNEKEAKLNEIFENKQDSPEIQLQKAEALAKQVSENHVTLENLEKDARGLTQNFRSRETTTLKSKLNNVRRQWESLCTRAKDKSTDLSGNVAHWQKYQALHEQLMPWMLKAEKYCASELPKCSSVDEAKDLYDVHQTFLQECEKHLPIFEQMTTEAGYLMDQPNMHQDLATLQRRWGSILASSDDRSHKMDKMYGTWTAYGKELESFLDVTDKIRSRLAKEPNINTSDVQVLEHELALAKALQEEVRSHQPQLNALSRQFDQVEGYASPEGLKVLKSKQDSIKSDWNDVNSAVAERQKEVASAVQHRKNFYERLQGFEKWVKNMQKKHDSGSEIYSDEVDYTAAKLKSMKDECKSQEPMFQGLHQELKELMAGCSDSEAAILSGRFDRLVQDYTQMEDQIGNREELYEKWSTYADVQKDIQAKIKALQARLASPDIQEDEVAQIKLEIEALSRTLQPWSRDADALDSLMSDAKTVIKDRATNKILHFGSELQNLQNVCAITGDTVIQKEAHLGALIQLNTDFTQKKEHLVGNLVQVQEKLRTAKVSKSSLQGLKDALRQLEDIRGDLNLHNPEHEKFKEAGRQIMAADPSKAAGIQQQLAQINSDWETVQSMLAEKQNQYAGVVNTWQQYNDSKEGVTRIISNLDPLMKEELAFSNQEDVKKSLDEHKKAEFELHTNQTHLDHMNNKGLQLLQDLKNIPGLDPSSIEGDLDDVNFKWEKANAVIEQHKNNLGAQRSIWDKVQSGVEEVGSWVNSMVNKLDEGLRHFDDAISVESRLTKFKEEAPYFQELMAEMNQKLQDLKELNNNKSVLSLTSAHKDIQLQFEKATSFANQLESMISTFSEEQQGLQKALSDETQWMNQLKEDLSKCDDITGSTENLIQRYETIKHLQQELVSHQRQISTIQDKSASLHRKYASSETSSIAKDSAVVNKKFEALMQRADHIQSSLLGQLEQQCTEAQQQQLRWLNAAKEKVSWCNETAGDRFTVEAKLATLKELEAGIQEGEHKRQEVINRLDAVKGILPKSRQGELEASHKNMEKEWQNFIKTLHQTQNNLTSSMDQWQQYDQRFETLSQWLKDTEIKLRSESSLKPDLASKKDQLELFRALDQSVQSHSAEVEDIKDIAQQISHVSGDSRIISQAGHLVSRYQILASTVKEMTKKCDLDIDDHGQYLSKHNTAVEWLSQARMSLEKCSHLTGDGDSLDTKLAIVKDLLVDREEGCAYFNAAVETGEILYPTTSVEGRDNIRRELRSLRDAWEGFSNSLNDTKRQLDSSKVQWVSFDEDFDQLNKWVMNMESQIEMEPELKATLQEKTALLQQYKTSHQVILSRQTMIDSISDKGAALSSIQVQNKLKQLNSMYNHLCKISENRWKKAEDYVNEHQLYQESYQQCNYWLNATRDRASAFAEVGGDKQALHNRLERLQDLVGSLPEGEAKVKSAHQLGDKTIPHMSSQGQAIIRHELNSLSSEWDNLVTRIHDTQQGLMQTIKAVEVYDGSCETLHHWLREIESQLKDCELKSTLHEKESQVEVFKSLQQDIHSKQNQFRELENLASQVESSDIKRANYSSQLITKYETLKKLAQDITVKWEGYVEEHHTFQENHGHCMEWVDTLRRRLQVCGDLAGDKHDVEDRMSKLKELQSERDKGTRQVHQTIERGERLFSSTSSGGRDTVRQDIRNLKDRWEALIDEVTEVQHKLDVNLSQWSSYDENFEVFQKWLLDIEVKLNEDAEPQATLPEKKAQLQNYKVLHQDILSREHIVDNLTEKAHVLTQSAPSAKVKKFVGELKNKYAMICETSRGIVSRLENSLHDHQQYQDAAQDFTDWLSSAHGRLEACTDWSGDKLSLRSKKDRLKEFSSSIKDGEQKLNHVQKLGATIARNTSPQGQVILQREQDHMKKEWEDYLSFMKSTENSLDKTLNMWETFESKLEQFSEWLKDIEQKVKGFDLKNTSKEKQTQLEKFKKQHEEILAHQPQIDMFAHDAQSLMHTNFDVRLNTQLTNKYQGLLSLVKDLVTKWERYVQEHHFYDRHMEEFRDWMVGACQKLNQCTQPVRGHESLQEVKAMIQILLTEKDHGHHKLSLAIESGEKLYTDTGADGREYIRQELRTAKQDWENLLSGLNDIQSQVDSYLHLWSSYIDGQDQMLKWMAETEASLRADVDLKDTLQEKRHQLQMHKSLLQDITSHQRLIDGMIKKAQEVLQSTANPQVSTFINSISSRYELLIADVKKLIQRSEQHVTVHQQYQDSRQAVGDWLALMKDKQTLCADTMGDKHTIQSKLERLHELINCVSEGATKFKDCENHAQITMDTTGLKGRQNIQTDQKILRTDWEDYTSKLKTLKDSLGQAEHYWSLYESSYQQLSSWLSSMEKEIKECPLKSTQEEKEEQLLNYQDLMQKMKGQQRELDLFTDEAQTLQHLTSESRVSNLVSQLTSRYQALLTSGKELIKRCQQNVEDHRMYKTKFTDCSHWLEKAKKKFNECTDSGKSRAELENRLEKVQNLISERDTGYTKLNQCAEAGEKLYPTTAPDGREVIRQELRKLKLGYESMFDDLSTIQRKLTLSMVQWTSFDESYDQVKHWLLQMESQLEGHILLMATLSEKKTQLRNYKALQQDVMSYQRVVDSISDKAGSLIHTSRDSELAQFISQTETRYKKLCSAAKERICQYETFVSEHEQYNDLYNSCVEWLNASSEKLSTCSDVSGDQHAIQSRLHKIQDFLTTQTEGVPIVKQVVELSSKVLLHTAPEGKEIITKETEALKADWEAFIMALTKTRNDLEACIKHWKDFEAWHDRCKAWLADVESQLRNIDLKATLQEKQMQLDKIKMLQTEVASHRNDLDSLNEAAQMLVRVSTDSHAVNQVSKLTDKYQLAAVRIKEMCQQWEQYMLDHHVYTQSLDECQAWLLQITEKMATVIDTSGDKSTVQDRLDQVQKLLHEKEGGIHNLQVALNNLQIVLPNTSVPGRDIMRHDMQKIQQQYDSLSAKLNDAKIQLDDTFSQWTVYDDSVEQLQRWLAELEDQISADSTFQNTLQEKKLQLDRIKVLQLNILSQQSTIDSLNVKAKHLKQTSRNGNIGAQISVVVDQYAELVQRVKNLNEQCDKNLQDHQEYRDAYMDASDWLGAAIDKLSSCSDVKGDKHVIETQLRKLEDIALTLEAGRRKLQTAQQKGDIVIPETSASGQQLIHEELKMLTRDFQGFQSDLSDLKNTLIKLKESWDSYGDKYEELSLWIKNTESGMQAESDLKDSLDQKIDQLNRHKTTHGNIIQQQGAFDQLTEQANILMRSSTDGRMALQLTQLTSKYSGLMGLSKDFLKRYEQAVQDHEQYRIACSRLTSWLQETCERVSLCADTSGDHFKIQTQLEKLQELDVAKAEGQNFLHKIVTCGQKTMVNTSVEGREVIRTELQKLQADWDLIISQMANTRLMLESCLLEWNDYSASQEQVIKWLKDMELRIHNTQLKADLSQKKAELLRIKAMYEEIMSFEQKVESVTCKATSLTERSPVSRSTIDTSQIHARYNKVKEQAKDLLASSENNVAHHQDFQNSSHSFSSWLQMATEKLATCSNISGQKSTIEAHIEKLKLLLANLSEGSQLLSHLTKAAEATMPGTSVSGQTKIKQELQIINNDFEKFHKQLVQTYTDLENSLTRWDEHDHSCHDFGNWLTDMEALLHNELDLKSTVEEKKEQWEKYRRLKEDVMSHQSSLDKVNDKAQSLLKIRAADVKVSHVVAQLTARYNIVITQAKDITNNLETYYNNHKLYKHNHQLFADWLREAGLRLQAVKDGTDSKRALNDKIIEVNEIQHVLDQGHTILRAVLESSEKTLPNTDQTSVHIIKHEVDTAKADYENILSQLSQVKHGLEKSLAHWEDFEDFSQHMTGWMSDMEKSLATSPSFKADISGKRSDLERYKALQADILAHKSELQLLEDKAGQVKDSVPRTRAADLRSRYEILVKNSRTALSHVEDKVGSQEEYRKSYISCLDWLSNTKFHLQQLADYTGDKRTLQDRLHQLRDFKTSLSQGHEMLSHIIAQGDRLRGFTSVRGQDVFQKEIASLQEDWNVFSSAVADVEYTLEASITKWTELDDEHYAFRIWLEDMENKVKDCMESKANLSRKKHQLQKAEDLYDEILSYGSQLNKIRATADTFAKKGNAVKPLSNIMQLSSRYQALCASAEKTVCKLKELMHTHRLHNEVLDRATDWLKMMMLRVQACSDSSGDWHTIQDRIEDIKDVILNMDEGLEMVNYACDQAEKILPCSSLEGKKMIEEQVTELTNSWEKLNSDIAECSAVLEGVQQRWHEYEEYYGSLIKWLADTEDSLKSTPELISHLPEHKIQLDKFKMIVADIENHHRLMNELADRVANLEALCDNPEVTESLAEIQDRYVTVADRSKEIVELLQRGYDEHRSFSEGQQDCEKWLLAMSYRLMAHNTLHGSKLEPTNRQMDKYKLILKEIEDYRLTLDSIIKRGQQLILNNPCQPRLTTQVQAQLTNLEESYNNLLSTAHQIGMTSLVSYSPKVILRYL